MTAEEFEKTDLRGKKLLFSISLGESGINLEYYSMLKLIRLRRDCFEGSVGASSSMETVSCLPNRFPESWYSAPTVPAVHFRGGRL